jgi:hypothetical protein
MTKDIQVFLRHCYYSKLQELPDRTRPFWFNKSKVFDNFKNTIDLNLAEYHIVYDEYYGSIENTFLKEEKNVKIIKCGSECDSFIETLDYVKSQNYAPDTIIYFLEDDYVHYPGWCDIILEAFTLNASYVTLYDFDFFLDNNIFTKIFTTKNTHWRAVPATTNTFACKYSTLLKDYEIHKEYSLNGIKEEDGYHFSRDYDKFWKLSQDCNKYVISPIPGYSTHCDKNHISPFRDWKKIINIDYHKVKINNKINYYYE